MLEAKKYTGVELGKILNDNLMLNKETEVSFADVKRYDVRGFITNLFNKSHNPEVIIYILKNINLINCDANINKKIILEIDNYIVNHDFDKSEIEETLINFYRNLFNKSLRDFLHMSQYTIMANDDKVISWYVDEDKNILYLYTMGGANIGVRK